MYQAVLNISNLATSRNFTVVVRIFIFFIFFRNFGKSLNIIGDNIIRLGLVKDDAHNRDKWKSLTTGNHPTLPQCGNEGVVLYGFCCRDVKR